MFAKGAWAILGVTPESEKTFLDAVNASDKMHALSQANAVATLLQKPGGPMMGVNPFANPRKDELGDPLAAAYAGTAPDPALFGIGEKEFRISPDMPWYGFWVVFNEGDDVDDIKSKREQLAYSEFSRPVKLLGKDQKKHVEEMTKPRNVGTRKQFPVLLDFASGRAYVASVNKEEVGQVRALLDDMGVAVHDLAWDFGERDWAEAFLNKALGKNKFHEQMESRANDIRRGIDIQPDEDPATERILKNFFALSELDSGQWAGLFPDAAIKLYEGGTPVTASDPSDAFNLLNLHNNWGVRVQQAGVVFQELDSKFNKKGEEKQFRTDLFVFDLNQSWELPDEGAAVIRGFDAPGLKKTILKALRQSKQEQPVAFYWAEWLRALNEGIHVLVDNVNLTLGKKGIGLSMQAAADADDTELTDFDTSGEEGVPLPSVKVRTAKQK